MVTMSYTSFAERNSKSLKVRSSEISTWDQLVPVAVTDYPVLKIKGKVQVMSECFARETFCCYWSLRVFIEMYGQNSGNSHSWRCCSHSYEIKILEMHEEWWAFHVLSCMNWVYLYTTYISKENKNQQE